MYIFASDRCVVPLLYHPTRMPVVEAVVSVKLVDHGEVDGMCRNLDLDLDYSPVRPHTVCGALTFWNIPNSRDRDGFVGKSADRGYPGQPQNLR